MALSSTNASKRDPGRPERTTQAGPLLFFFLAGAFKFKFLGFSKDVNKSMSIWEGVETDFRTKFYRLPYTHPCKTTELRLVQIQIQSICRQQLLDSSKLKKFADDNFKVDENGRKFSKTGRKHCGKRRNCSLRAISPFPSVFSKALYCRHVKTRACLGKG